MKRTPLPQIDSCAGCGVCCLQQAALPVHLLRPEVAGTFPVTPLPPALVAELQAVKDGFLANGFPPDGSPCIWFDPATQQCKHYAHRPELCRDGVRVGDEACRRWRRRYRVDPVRVFRIINGKLRAVIVQRKAKGARR